VILKEGQEIIRVKLGRRAAHFLVKLELDLAVALCYQQWRQARFPGFLDSLALVFSLTQT